MAKVYLTEDQRRRAKYEARCRVIGDGLTLYKARNQLTNLELGKTFGLNHETVAKIMSGKDVKISMLKFWRLLDIAGVELKIAERTV